jgi:hypothetical protein
VTLATLDRLTRTLDGIFRHYGNRKRLPLWLTEYGYQTDPPDNITGVPWKRQADYLGRAENISYRNRRVRSLTQFLLIDDAPNTSVPPSSSRYWGSTFQTGFVTREGKRKDAFFSYQRSFDITPRLSRRGGPLRVFGQLRPAASGSAVSATVEFRRRGSHAFKAVRTVTTRSLRNYLVAHVRAGSSSGWWRVSFRNPAGGAPLTSTELYVGVRR